MKAEFLAGLLLALLILAPVPVACRTAPATSQEKGAPPAKNGEDRSSGAKDAQSFPQVLRISAEEVKRMLEEKAKMVLVDTRDSLSYDDGHIQGAVNVYYDPTVDPRDREPMLTALPMDKLIVISCDCNNEEDSAPMVMELLQLGYDRDKVKALRGGTLRWNALHYPVYRTPPNASAEKEK